jgi:two-component system sensor kinase FixL
MDLNADSSAKLSLSRVAPTLAIGIILLFTAGTASLYFLGTRTLQSQFEAQSRVRLAHSRTEEAFSSVFAEVDKWVRDMTLATALGGAGIVFAFGMGMAYWRRRTSSSTQEIEMLKHKVEKTKALVQWLKSEKARLGQDLREAYDEQEKLIQERTAELSKTCATLEKELNSRRQAEKALTYQAKELERSKDVLELHVQARTQELQKLKSRYESILNSAGEGIYGLDLQGRTTFVNPAAAKVTGWEIEEMVGKTEQEAFSLSKEPVDGEVNGLKIDQDGHHLSEQEFRRKDGSLFPVEYVRTAITENGRLFGAVVVFKDITERKRTEEALAQKAAALARSNAELEQFAFVASHDMQEPLRKIQAFGDRLKTQFDAAGLLDGKDYLERMLRAAARMQTLINDLLTFSRVISSSRPFVPVNLSEITKEVLSDLEVRIEQTKARIELSELPTIEADSTQMRQLLQNLIGNALKFSKPGQPPVVRISANLHKASALGIDGDGEAEVCQLEIQDNGIGFEEQYREKIFAVFQRLHGRSQYEGTGVGLAVCRRITERHNGSITAHSQPGQGATFVVTLPATRNQKSTP